MRCRKCNFVLIDVKVGVLLTFLASMKAKVRSYQKYVSIFGCLHVKKWIHLCVFQVSVFKVLQFGLHSEFFVLHVRFHCFRVNRRPKQWSNVRF